MYQHLSGSPIDITEAAFGDFSGAQSQPPEQCEHRKVTEARCGTPVAAGEKPLDPIWRESAW
jgi:hypothetical protein